MYILGIESTAHTFGVGIIDSNGNILANKKALFTTESGGMTPRIVADHHIEKFDSIIKDALNEAKIKINDIKLISFSQSPGIGNCLKIGAIIARSVSKLLNCPLIGINHCIAHLEIGKLCGFDENNNLSKDPILLYASGANTQIIGFSGEKYRIFGETLDIGIGNFIDTFARYINIGFPGGPKIELLAKKSKKFIDLGYLVKGMDINFSGILTKLKNLYDLGHSKYDLAFSLQETSFSMLIEVAERALAHTGKNELLLGGGVACNKRLKEMAIKMCNDRGAKCYFVDNSLNVDNGVMIAWAGLLKFLGELNLKFNNIEELKNINFEILIKKYNNSNMKSDYIWSKVNPY
ncbi:tRNA (adenosine(37)-N6)-threonylcarbamoyltransferase complex transferase subunit TsaD, partial [Candidatus Woesearchaeota archaeon]|nr:tRNA (adenosine(37)-N6)-threonylcarbamoyltransferase complex transferase subunit TsaD [Candidatus Woesearchaeota archaeon]